MAHPKSIYLENRKNLEWLNEKMILKMRELYNTRFVMIGVDDKKNFLSSWLNKNDYYYGIDSLGIEADRSKPENISAIYMSANKYEKKYGITYMRDGILQDRSFAYNFVHNKVENFVSKNTLSYEEIVNRQNYFFDYAEKLFRDKKIDLVIARPDSLLGFAVTTVAKHLNIPVTVQSTTRVNSYMYWTYGAYMQSNQISDNIKKLKQDKVKIEDPNLNEKIASHSFKDRANLIRELSLKSLANEIIYILKDSLNWFIKDIKKGRLGKRVSIFTRMSKKIKAYREHCYLQSIFEGDINIIKKDKFIYFPLPTEPEFNTHSLCKEFLNTHAMIQQIAISLPTGYNLVIKEHTPNIGQKPRDFYTRLKKIPNLIIANYLIPGPQMVDSAEAIVTVAGSSAIEAAEKGKMAVVLASSSEYFCLPNIILGHSMRDMPKILLQALKKVSAEKRQDIMYEANLYKQVLKKIGYYAPDTPPFHGKNTKILDKELKKAIEELIIVWKLQKSNSSIKAK
jgi:hypothetical protein